MKTRILLECQPLAELVEDYLIKFKEEECSYESDDVKARTEEEKEQDAIDDLNKLINECLMLVDDFDEAEEDEAEESIGKHATEILEIVVGVKLLVPSVTRIEVAKDLINIIVEVDNADS